jgi:hypothetical protein
LTRVLTSAEHAEVVADRERDRVAWNLPRQPSPVLHSRGADHQETVQRGLDWQGFLSLYFPGRRRHDLAALTAYGAYRASPDIDEPSPEEVLLGSRAAEAWEDEGGAAL